MLNCFNSLVTAAVLLILIIAAGNAVMRNDPFDPMALALSVSMLLILPVLLKLASRRRREEPARPVKRK